MTCNFESKISCECQILEFLKTWYVSHEGAVVNLIKVFQSWFMTPTLKFTILWAFLTLALVKYQNGWLKYDHRVMYKKYTTSLPFYGMWGSRKTSWDGPANKKLALVLQILFLRNKCNFLKLPKFMVKYFGTY